MQLKSPFFGEFMGTMMMILLGDGVVAGVLLKRSKAENSGWIVITGGWCFAVMAGIYTAIACGSSDAHLNPAITLGAAVVSGDYSKLISYLPAQMLGAFVGAILVWLQFLPHWKETPDVDLKRACFCTAPAIRSTGANLLSEIIATFVLVFVVAAIFSKAVGWATGLTSGLGAYLVASLVWGIGLSLGGTTGYAINPARDLGPRIVHALLPIAGKGDSDWRYAPIPILGLSNGARAGLTGFVAGVARQVAKHNVRVGAVAPGMVLNELWGLSDPEEIRVRAERREGLLSEDVAEAVVFMLTRPPNVTIRDLVMLPQNQDL